MFFEVWNVEVRVWCSCTHFTLYIYISFWEIIILIESLLSKVLFHTLELETMESKRSKAKLIISLVPTYDWLHICKSSFLKG